MSTGISVTALPPAWPSSTAFQLRSDYQSAREKLRQGQIGEYRQIARRLSGYVLHPYLDYYYLRNRLSSTATPDVVKFLHDNPELPVTPLLRKRWLRVLGKRRQWNTLRKHYQPTSDAEIRCYHLRSLYGTGDKARALDEATSLWLQPTSQPKACDPLFEVWRNTSRFTETVVWQRFSAALAANERSLARYLMRYLNGDTQKIADAFYAVHVNPSRITRTGQYRTDTTRRRELLVHGLTRLARQDARKAAAAWHAYRDSRNFEATAQARLDGVIAVALAKQENHFPPDEQRARLAQADLVEELAFAAVHGQQWTQASLWIGRLPDDLLGKLQWQYWLARAWEQTEGTNERSLRLYDDLSAQRHYYGFLASRHLGLPGKMNASAADTVSTIDLQRIQRVPGISRSIELFAVGDDLNGRREWFKALNGMQTGQQITAAELALHFGLTAMAIRTANIAEAGDHLHLRFPLVFEPQFRQASMKTTMPMPLLMAVARQESAMESKARSSADARGLMQLLPSTARVVARRALQSIPRAIDLYDPGTNIALGSYHLAWLMSRYKGQAPLALAAYNAGEHRVDRWIRDAAGMSMDVWIETIPFRETRNYVKNVLAFRHVYGSKLNAPAPVLNISEQHVTPR